MSFYADNDRGAKVWELINGPQGFFTSRMFPLASFTGALPGQAVTVALQDITNLFSDTRQIALVWDDSEIDNVGLQDEGTTAAYQVNKTGDTLTVWCDTDVPGQVRLLSKDDAQSVVADDNQSVGESIADKLTRLQKESNEQNLKILVGVGVVAVIFIVAAAYALPRTKIPKLSVA
jgi:hypothetical protein